MSFALKWSRQSVVSFVLLAFLFCIGASILLVHEQNSQPPFSMSFQQGNGQSAGGSAELIPGSSFNLPLSFDFFGDLEQYGPDDLFEKINGKAPLYLDSGFTSLHSRRFISREDPALWLEVFVYDMGAPLNAFSVYSTQRRPGAQTMIALETHDHYKTENGLYLQHGNYYIECVGSVASPRLDEAMTEIGRSLLAVGLPGDKDIAALQLFPRENLIDNSFKLVLNNAFGSDALYNTFMAGYRVNGQSVTAFISRRNSPEEAERSAGNYHDFLIDGGGSPVSTQSSIKAVDLYGLVEVVFTVGACVAGVHEAENLEAGLEVSRNLRDALLAAGGD